MFKAMRDPTSLLCTTITNTYDNVSCMDSPSGSQTYGFQDGCIRI